MIEVNSQKTCDIVSEGCPSHGCAMNISSDDAVELVASLLGEGTWGCKLFGEGKFSQTFKVMAGF